MLKNQNNIGLNKLKVFISLSPKKTLPGKKPKPSMVVVPQSPWIQAPFILIFTVLECDFHPHTSKRALEAPAITITVQAAGRNKGFSRSPDITFTYLSLAIT